MPSAIRTFIGSRVQIALNIVQQRLVRQVDANGAGRRPFARTAARPSLASPRWWRWRTAGSGSVLGLSDRCSEPRWSKAADLVAEVSFLLQGDCAPAFALKPRIPLAPGRQGFQLARRPTHRRRQRKPRSDQQAAFVPPAAAALRGLQRGRRRPACHALLGAERPGFQRHRQRRAGVEVDVGCNAGSAAFVRFRQRRSSFKNSSSTDGSRRPWRRSRKTVGGGIFRRHFRLLPETRSALSSFVAAANTNHEQQHRGQSSSWPRQHQFSGVQAFAAAAVVDVDADRRTPEAGHAAEGRQVPGRHHHRNQKRRATLRRLAVVSTPTLTAQCQAA